MSSDYYYEELMTRDFTADAKVNLHVEFKASDKVMNELVMDYIEENPDNESEEKLWEMNEYWQNHGYLDETDPVFAHQGFLDFAKEWMIRRILTSLSGNTKYLRIENIVFDYDEICDIMDYEDIECVIQAEVSAMAHLDDMYMGLYSPDDPDQNLEYPGYDFEDSDCRRVLDVNLFYELNDERGEYLRVKNEAIERGIRDNLIYILEDEADCIRTDRIGKIITVEIADLRFTEQKKDWDAIWKRAYEEYRKRRIPADLSD